MLQYFEYQQLHVNRPVRESGILKPALGAGFSVLGSFSGSAIFPTFFTSFR